MIKLKRFSLLLLVAVVGCMAMLNLKKGDILKADSGSVSADYGQGKVSLTYADFVAVDFGLGTPEVWNNGQRVAKLERAGAGVNWNELVYTLSEKLKDGTYQVRIPSGAVSGNKGNGSDYSSLSSAVVNLEISAAKDIVISYLGAPAFEVMDDSGVNIIYHYPDSATLACMKANKQTVAVLYEDGQRVSVALSGNMSDDGAAYGVHFDYQTLPGKEYKVVFPEGSWYAYATNNGHQRILEESAEQSYAWVARDYYTSPYDFAKWDYEEEGDEYAGEDDLADVQTDVQTTVAYNRYRHSTVVPANAQKGWTFADVFPSQGDVESLRKVEFTYDAGLNNLAKVQLQCPDGSTVGVYIYESYGSINGTFDELMTETGEYTLIIPAGTLLNSYDQPNGDMSYTWTIDATRSWDEDDRWLAGGEDDLAYEDAADELEVESVSADSGEDEESYDFDSDVSSVNYTIGQQREEALFKEGGLGEEMLQRVSLSSSGVKVTTENYYNANIDFDFPVRYNQYDRGEINWINGTKLKFTAKDNITGILIKGDYAENASADKGTYRNGLWTGSIKPGETLTLTSNDAINIHSVTVLYNGVNLEQMASVVKANSSVSSSSDGANPSWSNSGSQGTVIAGSVAGGTPSIGY